MSDPNELFRKFQQGMSRQEAVQRLEHNFLLMAAGKMATGEWGRASLVQRQALLQAFLEEAQVAAEEDLAVASNFLPTKLHASAVEETRKVREEVEARIRLVFDIPEEGSE